MTRSLAAGIFRARHAHILFLAYVIASGCVDGTIDEHDADPLLEEAEASVIPAMCTTRVGPAPSGWTDYGHHGSYDTEDEYLFRLLGSEFHSITDGPRAGEDAPIEALKAQAIAARSFMYVRAGGPDANGVSKNRICNSVACQAFWSAAFDRVARDRPDALDKFREVIESTRGIVITGGVLSPSSVNGVVQAFYKAGTYSCTARKNSGDMGQNNAACHAHQGKNYVEILKYFYGSSMTLTKTVGACIGDYAGYFGDDENNVHEKAIDAIAEAGITKGCGSMGSIPLYCPDQQVSRGQMAVFLKRAAALPTSSTDYFDDDDGAWYEDAANAVAAAGITKGCGTRRFCGNDAVNRAQMAVFLTRALELPATTKDYFDDDDGAWYENAANQLYESGITKGCGTRTFCGDKILPRDEMASFLARAFL